MIYGWLFVALCKCEIYPAEGAAWCLSYLILRPVLHCIGMSAPSHALSGVEEQIRCEEFVLIGTPNQIRTAVEEIRAKLKSKANAGDGAK